MQYERKEQPYLYWKDIDVVVEQVDRRHWLACGHHYEVKVTVRSDEYPSWCNADGQPTWCERLLQVKKSS